ncbi:NAD-dependent epimerase/dehydratase family protein [Halorubellus sp. PRR65]|uniref:NAD-dependent epimerase/dehydratase family protein n=1 Tax=Halorubellus sp. PRR65 TaxID=3098148 RepID=UPI002B259902|nr:NAD-dependent epimerase/dehydratase family protein [Halorubellus sp. PRR65]
MDSAFVIGGTRFIGRHLVAELLAHDYDVTIFNRGTHENPFADDDRVTHVAGDRTDDADLASAARESDYDAVFDMVAYQPREVRTATRVFDDADAYVYVSSGAAYGEEEMPKREGALQGRDEATALEPCTDEQAVDDSGETYGARKAEGDRALFAAAEERGVRAMSVRPCIVYGPDDYTERLDFWIDRVAEHDRVVVPGDGTNVWHRAYVEDVASALRVVAEEGTAGEAYNVGDRRLVTLEEMVDVIADCLGDAADAPDDAGDVEVVHASERELSVADLAGDDYVLYREYPHVLDTEKLAALGWEATPLREAMQRSVDDHLASDRDGSEYDPGRDDERALLDVLDTL